MRFLAVNLVERSDFQSGVILRLHIKESFPGAFSGIVDQGKYIDLTWFRPPVPTDAAAPLNRCGDPLIVDQRRVEIEVDADFNHLS